MSRVILVPLDTSELAERVLHHIRCVWSPETTDLVLLGVVEPWRYYYGAADYNPPAYAESLYRGTQEYLEEQQAKLCESGYRVSIEVVSGDPAEMILEVAKALDVELIAMSTHGRSGLVRLAMGSVAERVTQDATMPVLLVRQSTCMPATGRIKLLVPLDGSKRSEAALSQARDIAAGSEAEIVLLHVLETPVEDQLRYLLESKEELDAMLADWQSEVQAYLESVAEKLRSDGLRATIRLYEGKPALAIEQIVEEEQIDLVVMSTHGRTGISRWVYGSVANKVLHSVDCPLILVRAAQIESSEGEAAI